MKVGVGITTYKRPEYFEKCIKSVLEHLDGVVDEIAVYNDGSKLKDYQAIYKKIPQVTIEHKNKNKGVAAAKNWLIGHLLCEECDYIFLLEDDIVIKDPKAVTEYINSGEQHLLFAHHGKANACKPLATKGVVEYYPNCVGAWCMYTKECIEDYGLMDSGFKNAWEHVEHSLRILGGMAFPDIKGSKEWLEEQENAIESSVIRNSPEWNKFISDGVVHWLETNPETFPFKKELGL